MEMRLAGGRQSAQVEYLQHGEDSSTTGTTNDYYQTRNVGQADRPDNGQSTVGREDRLVILGATCCEGKGRWPWAGEMRSAASLAVPELPGPHYLVRLGRR